MLHDQRDSKNKDACDFCGVSLRPTFFHAVVVVMAVMAMFMIVLMHMLMIVLMHMLMIMLMLMLVIVSV